VLEEWTGHKLEPTSMYGIRVYSDNSVLATRKHCNASILTWMRYYTISCDVMSSMRVDVDRLPLVSSCIIQVAQDVDEPWPIEVYDHNGKAWNVTMQPGDLTLYESHTVLHGRPFPMKGRFYVSYAMLCYVVFIA
jgi:prolyl 4-hydroxylase